MKKGKTYIKRLGDWIKQMLEIHILRRMPEISKYDSAFDLLGENNTCIQHWTGVNSFAEAAPSFVAVAKHYFGEGSKPLTDIPCVYINRKQDVARKHRMEEAFTRFSTSVTRIEAVTPESSLFQDSVSAAVNLTGFGKEVTPTTASIISITISHILAIHTAYTKGFESVLFLEDDATLDLLPFWEDSLDQYVSQLPKGWLASQVGHTLYGSWLQPKWHHSVWAHGKRLRHRTGHEWGAFAYLLSRRGMEIIQEKYWDSKRNMVDLDALAADCIGGLQADDCLLGFYPEAVHVQFNTHPKGKQGPFQGQVTVADPPLFTINAHISSTAEGRAAMQGHKSAAVFGYCGSVKRSLEACGQSIRLHEAEVETGLGEGEDRR
jgi:hypothetical protein